MLEPDPNLDVIVEWILDRHAQAEEVARRVERRTGRRERLPSVVEMATDAAESLRARYAAGPDRDVHDDVVAEVMTRLRTRLDQRVAEETTTAMRARQ